MALNLSKLFGRGGGTSSAVQPTTDNPETALGGPDTAQAHDKFANLEVSHIDGQTPTEGIMVWNGEAVSHAAVADASTPDDGQPMGSDWRSGVHDIQGGTPVKSRVFRKTWPS